MGGLMSALSAEQSYNDRLARSWRGSYALLAFLFAPPDEPTIEMLNRRGVYFDARTGDTWDLFFPGYYCSNDRQFERQVHDSRLLDDGHSVGDRYTNNWYFNSFDFNELRRHVEESTRGGWQYSGGSDLVLVNAYVPEFGEPTIDWTSTQSGSIQPPETLATVVERISRDIEQDNEDSAYGVGSVTNATTRGDNNAVRGPTQDFTIQALAGIATALALKAAGI